MLHCSKCSGWLTSTHLNLQENWRLKKLVVAIDKDRGRTRGMLLETDARNEAILGHLRNQESFEQINDYKIDKVTEFVKIIC